MKIRTLMNLMLALGALGLLACVPPANNTNSVNTNTNASPSANVAANANTAPPDRSRESMPVTLPVLDAMFSDESFANELRMKLQLTDEQIDRLRTISGEAVVNLSEEETADTQGSTRASAERAETAIKQILGDEKANQFFRFVRERWEGGMNAGGPSAAPAAPSSVPTDTRIVVNAPAYRMDVFQDGRLVKTYKVGIGYPEFPLPSGMRKADTIIFNPTWTPPDEPWVKGKVQPGKKVEAGDKLNPLGPIKIPIGLPSLIHGGKSPARLGTFASHGCVGLTDSQVKDFSLELARLGGADLTLEDITNYGKNKTETKNVKLANPVPVELRYETIVVENGTLKIFRDVYERGTNTEENLRRTLQAFGVSLDNLQDREKILAGLKEMANDAGGKPVEANSNVSSMANANGNQTTTNKNANVQSDKVTKNVP